MPEAKAPRISLIVTTYNRPDALERVLEAIAGLRPAAAEVLVADDGSTAATADLLARWQGRLPVPLRHLWQPDAGFRAGRIRNLAAAGASGDYLVFLDGDCLVFADFIAGHAALAEGGRFVAGNRLLLSPALTEAVLAGVARPLAWGIGGWLKARLGGGVNRLLPLLRLPGRAWRLARPRRWQGARTCNLGVWRRDLLAINGFDEAYEGWGHEDADLAARLIAAGVSRKSGRGAVPVLHLWHPPSRRGREAENRQRLEETLAGRRPSRAAQGLDTHLE